MRGNGGESFRLMAIGGFLRHTSLNALAYHVLHFPPFFFSERPVNPWMCVVFSSLSLVPTSWEGVWEISLIGSTWHGLDGSSRLGTAWYSRFILCSGFCCPRSQKLGKWKVLCVTSCFWRKLDVHTKRSLGNCAGDILDRQKVDEKRWSSRCVLFVLCTCTGVNDCSVV